MINLTFSRGILTNPSKILKVSRRLAAARATVTHLTTQRKTDRQSLTRLMRARRRVSRLTRLYSLN